MAVTVASLVAKIGLEGEGQVVSGLQNVNRAAQESSTSLKSVESSSTSSGGSLAGSFASGVSSAASHLFSFVTNAGSAIFSLKQIGEAAVGTAMSLLGPAASAEQVQKSLETMLGSTKAATEEMAKLNQFASQTPFETMDIDKAAEKMLSVGISADKVIPNITALGDGLAAMSKTSGADLDQIVSNFDKIQTSGHLTGDVMQSFSDAGINAYGILEQQTGKTHDELEKMISGGLIPANDAMDMLTKGIEDNPLYKGQMANQAGTLTGIMSTLKSTWNQVLAAFGSPILKALEPILTNIGTAIASPKFQEFATTVGQDIVSAVSFVVTEGEKAYSFFTRFGGILNSLPVKVFVADFTVLGERIGNLFGTVGKVAALFAGHLAPSLDGANKQAKSLFSEGLFNLDAIMNPISRGIADFTKELNQFDFSEIIGDVKQFAGTLTTDFWPILQNIVGLLSGQFITTLQDVGKDAKQVGGWFASDVVPALEKVLPIFEDLAKTWLGTWIPALIQVKSIVIDVVQHAFEKFAPIVERLVPPLIQLAGILAGGLSSAIKFLTPYFTAAAKEIGVFASGLIDRLAPIATNVVNGIINGIQTFSKIWNAVWPYASVILKGVWDEIVGIIQIAWSIVTGIINIGLDILSGNWGKAWDDLKSMLSGIWEGIKKYLSGAWEVIQGIFKAAWAGIVAIFTPVGKWFQDRWTDITKAFSNVGKWFSDRFQEAWNGISNLFSGIGKWFQDRWADITKSVSGAANNIKDNILKPFTEARDHIGDVIKGFANNLIDRLNDGIGSVEKFLNMLKNGLVGAASHIGVTLKIDDVKLGRVPHFALGGVHAGGPAIVGEEGPELAFLPAGTSILPHKASMDLLSLLGGNVPGYAGGIGDAASDAWNWITTTTSNVVSTIGDGAQAVLNWMLSAFHITAPDLGGLSDFASGFFNKMKDAALTWITDHLPHMDFGSTGSSSGPVSGDLESWIKQAIALTKVPANWLSSLETIAMHESGGSPTAVNNWDINAQNGDPSKGLFQTIGATFRAYALPGHGNILNPVDNAAAAIEYILSRYGSVFNVPGIVSMSRGGGYVGYASGTSFVPGGAYLVGERGPEVAYLPRGAQVIPNDRLVNLGSSPTIVVQAPSVYLDGRQLTLGMMPYLANEIRYNTGKQGL